MANIATSAISQTIHAPIYQRVVSRLLMRGLLGPPRMGSYLVNEAPCGATRASKKLAGAEGFEPSALGFGEPCNRVRAGRQGSPRIRTGQAGQVTAGH